MGQEKHFGVIHVGLLNTQPALIYPGDAPGISAPKSQRVQAEGAGETRTYGRDREGQGHLWHGTDTPSKGREGQGHLLHGKDTPSKGRDRQGQGHPRHE